MNIHMHGKALVPVVLVLLTSCATYQFRSEAEIPGLGGLGKITEAQRGYVEQVPAGTVDGRRMNVTVEWVPSTGSAGDGMAVEPEAEPKVLVLLHGLLSDRRAWRYIRALLGQDHELLIIDLPGCGESDKPMTDDPDAYSPDWLAEHTLMAMREAIRLRDWSTPPRLTLVGHSLGGTVALRMLANPDLRRDFNDVTSLVEDMVLFAPVDVTGVERVQPLLYRIATLTGIEVFLGDLLGIIRSQVSEAVKNGVQDPETMPVEEVDRLCEIMSNSETLDPAQLMILRAVPNHDLRPDWQRIEEMEAEYQNIDVPCLIVWGKYDETFGCKMGYKLRDNLPQAWLRVIPASMHTILSERPWICADLVERFVDLQGEYLEDDVDELPFSVIEASDRCKKGVIGDGGFKRYTAQAIDSSFRRSVSASVLLDPMRIP